MSASPETPDERVERTRRRRNGFALHIAGYFALMMVLVPVNLFWLAPATPWFLVPLVGWGAALAIHCAFVMGLFDKDRSAP